MLPESYDELNRLQTTHWWYLAQFDAIQGLLQKHTKGRFSRALDVGCGPGGYTRFIDTLADETTGVDVYDPALNHARTRFPGIRFINQDANDLAGVDNGNPFDLVSLFYMLCHQWVDEDKVLDSIRSVMQDDGYLLIADSAFPILFRRHDRAVQAARRYTRTTLTNTLERNGFSLVSCTYLNACLFPAVLLVALRDRLFDAVGYKKDEPPQLNLTQNSNLMNSVMHRVLTTEYKLFAPFGSPPLGINLVAIAQKKKA